MYKVTLAGLKTIDGLTKATDSNYLGRKDKTEHLIRLSIILDKLEEVEEFDYECYSANGQYMGTVTFSRANVYKALKYKFLTCHEGIDVFRTWLENWMNEED